MSLYRHILAPKYEILVPKIVNLGYFGPKQYLKTPTAQHFKAKNSHWVEIIKEKKRVENLRC